jgi:hypothetical protein
MTTSHTTESHWTVANDLLSLSLSPAAKGGLETLIDHRTGRNLIAAPPGPLYRLTLTRAGEEPIELTSMQADSVEARTDSASASQTLTLDYGPHGAHDIRVRCSVRLEAGSPLTRWRIAVRNRTSYGVRAIGYPVALAPAALGDSGDDDVFAWGFMGGNLIRRPGENLARYPGMDVFRSQHPGIMSVQMQAYYDDTAGLYMATYDAGGNVKAFNIARRGDAFDMTIEHNFDERPGLDFDLPYDTVLGVFHGDWYAAADLYKEWAVQQHWCSRKTTERDDIPAWLKEPRPVLFVGQNGDHERLRATLWAPPSEYPFWRHYPASRAVPLVRGYAERFGTPVVTFIEGWEKIGGPGGPVDIFPPAEGEESFKSAMAECARDGNHAALYLAGFQWCYKRSMRGYDGRERFEREGQPLAVLNPAGEIDHLAFWNNQKEYANLCVGSAATRELYRDNLMNLMDLGGVALQIDQQIGLYTEPCYSQAHGHPPGFGPWMHAAMLNFIREARQACKARNPEATLSYEVPCEVWIQEVDLHMHRPYHIRPYRLEAIPLFDYLYHEYALTFGGDTMLGLAHPEVELIKHALIGTLGVQNLINIGQPEWHFERLPDFPGLALMRSICQAQRTFARPFLVLGRMLKPAELAVAREAIDLWRPIWMSNEAEARQLGARDIPAVWHSAWEAPDGTLGYVLINWTGTAQPVRLSLARPGGELALVSAEGRTPLPRAGASGQASLTVPPRSAVLVEQKL